MSNLKEFFKATRTNLGTVFYPTHFVFAAFSSLELAQQASRALAASGFPDNEMQVASSSETEAFFNEFRSEGGPWGTFMRGLSREILSTQAPTGSHRTFGPFPPLAMMAAGTIGIERSPRRFNSPCSIHARFEAGQIAFFQLLLDTYALEKFRGEMD